MSFTTRIQFKSISDIPKLPLYYLKFVISIICIYFIFSEVKDRSSVTLINFEFDYYDSGLIFLVFMLMPVNWYLESLKWHLINTKYNSGVSFTKSIKQILNGLIFNWIFPFTTGDLLAKYDKNSSLSINTKRIALHRFSSILPTIIFGSISIVIWSIEFKTVQLNFTILLSASVALLLLVWFKDKVIFISFIRYAVFTLQYFLLLRVFNEDLSGVLILIGIFWVFLFRSFIPGLFGGIGIREASSLLFFENYISNITWIIVPGFMIWFINIVIPSLISIFAQGILREEVK
jgi:hypothetical protein